MRITTDDGVRLEVEVDGAGPGLLLVHGFGGAKEDFADHVSALARDHTVVVFDHRGHGESDKPSTVDAYSFDRLLADALAVADASGLERFRLLGHSMGGMVARKLVLAEPDRVDALILMDTAAGPIPSFDPALLELAAQLALDEGKAALKAALDAAAALETPAYHRLLVERPGYKEFVDAKWAAVSEVMWAGVARAMARQSDDLAALAAVRCPTLVIVGALDDAFVEPSRALAATIPRAVLAVIPDAGHSPQFENANAWFATLRDFLTALVATSARE
ncbi:MAG: alpha/beta fold hydrolase [Actinomycetota bacterium]